MIELKIEEKNNIIIIHIKGECIYENINAVENILNMLINKEPGIIAVDFHDIEKIDSTAIGTFVKFLKITIEKNIKFILFDLNIMMKELFKKTCLNKYFIITTKKLFEKKYINVRN